MMRQILALLALFASASAFVPAGTGKFTLAWDTTMVWTTRTASSDDQRESTID